MFESTAGGVMTDEVGAVTGDLELLTRPTPDGDAIEALVRYADATDKGRLKNNRLMRRIE